LSQKFARWFHATDPITLDKNA